MTYIKTYLDKSPMTHKEATLLTALEKICTGNIAEEKTNYKDTVIIMRTIALEALEAVSYYATNQEDII